MGVWVELDFGWFKGILIEGLKWAINNVIIFSNKEKVKYLIIRIISWLLS